MEVGRRLIVKVGTMDNNNVDVKPRILTIDCNRAISRWRTEDCEKQMWTMDFGCLERRLTNPDYHNNQKNSATRGRRENFMQTKLGPFNLNSVITI